MKKEKKKYILVANWKMYLSYYESISFCTVNRPTLTAIAQKHTLIFLPSFIALNAVANVLQETDSFYGAQNCSAFDSGAYTGDISASMLAEIGCSYCLVAHSERRRYYQETDEQIIHKLHLLIKAGIIPVFCIGEPKQEQDYRKIKDSLKKQLALFTAIPPQQHLLIAYEPNWAIGKGNEIFNDTYLNHLIKITKLINTCLSRFPNAKILYGGSIDELSIKQLLSINTFDGFLIGRASTTFSVFETIIKAL